MAAGPFRLASSCYSHTFQMKSACAGAAFEELNPCRYVGGGRGSRERRGEIPESASSRHSSHQFRCMRQTNANGGVCIGMEVPYSSLNKARV